ncbi:AMP-binding protein [Actinomadura sp. LD22]|uniref:acetate--CoA ligase n=1 Tax=Actinomadura physcomitrii TaxID=2650748 RepID=A0A6I4M732_9ACTN|nr:AMP-binding protein [Actinomadura physcomitrii]MWA01593.1 AMP-binding protein [Actinomadura physcomitrii]
MTYVWHPGDEYLRNSNVARLMRRLGAATGDELRRASVADIGSFWDAVVDDLALPFLTPYREVVDLSRGVEWPDWFVGGALNAADACLRRWVGQIPDAVAVTHEAEDGTTRSLTFAQLDDEVARLRGALRARGVTKGDAVALYLPMGIEAVVTLYAVASLGAMLVPLFSGFAASAIAARVGDARAKVMVCADATVRRGRVVQMLPVAREAAAECPSLELVIVVGNVEESVALKGSEVAWETVLSERPDPDIERTAASDVLLLAYTSGTTGKPKGAVHTHAGFVVKTACEVAYGFDVAPGRTFSWITDMGWIMGPLSILGTHANGGTLMLYEGSPDVPDARRLWSLVERHRISTLGVSPTLIRTLRSPDNTGVDYDLSSVRTIGSTGEPWDPESYEWLARDVFRERVPVINFSGGTEVGGSFLCPYPVEDIAACSLGGPALGMDVDVVDANGAGVRGEIGELVCRQPWPAMTRGIWNDPDRYHEAYWSTFPGLWRHGDHALVDDGGWFILGRSDDVMNVAGKRVAPAEIESVVAEDPAVREAAVVGIPDPTKGEGIWVFYVAGSGDDEARVEARIRERVATRVGKPFAPSHVVQVSELPKTRSAKILRRAIRAAVVGTDPGDLSGAENPAAVETIRARVRELR